MIEGPDGWSFTPEGAAVHAERALAVVADVHLGYEWARAAGGDVVPAHSLAETLDRLDRLTRRATIRRLVVAGDLVERPQPCPRTWSDVQAMRRWLEARSIELVPLKGNHDPAASPPLPPSLEVAGWTILHGDRPLRHDRTMSGHHHPILRTAEVSAPCFLAGPTRIVLPAFSRNAAGLNVLAEVPRAWLTDDLRCIAGLGETLLDFGPLSALRSRAQAARPSPRGTRRGR